MKSKEELDLLNTYDEVMSYRRLFLTNNNTNLKKNDQYYNELDFYMKVRFKDKELEMFQKWENEVKNNIGDELSLRSKALIIKNGFDGHYAFGVAHDLLQIKKFKYIKGIEHNLDEKGIKLLQTLWK